MKSLMREIVDAVDGAGREFKKGFGSAFRKRGGKRPVAHDVAADLQTAQQRDAAAVEQREVVRETGERDHRHQRAEDG